MRNVIREAIEHDGFSFVDITSQCIENNGRRIGFANANEMLTFYRKTYKRAPKDADHLERYQIGTLYPEDGSMAAAQVGSESGAPDTAPAQPAGAMQSTVSTPGAAGATGRRAASAPDPRPPADDEERARRRAESQKRLALMNQLAPDVKLRVAKREISLEDALREAGIDPDAVGDR